MVREYATSYYIPLAERAARLGADHERAGRELSAWREQLADAWSQVEIRQVTGDEGVAEIGQRREVTVVVALGKLPPSDVGVELLHGAVRADGGLDGPGTVVLVLDGVEGTEATYRDAYDVTASGEYGIAVRVVPNNADLPAWTDTGLVTWADAERLAVVGEQPA
jgi:hypothetical protein